MSAWPARVAALATVWLAGAGPVRAHDVGADAHGRPLACAAPAPAVAAAALPSDTRAWEVVPGVVRDDGVATFRIEMTVPAPVAAIRLHDRATCVPALAEPADRLRDDGTGGDRVAGDGVWTSVPLRLDPACPAPAFWGDDPASPPGLGLVEVGALEVEEPDGQRAELLSRVEVGVLGRDVPAVAAVPLAADVVATGHLVNVRTDLRATQTYLRFPSDALAELTQRVYAALPDAFDFLILFSTGKVERLPATAPRNFVAGSHRTVRVDWTGSGIAPVDDTARWGSRGRLLGIDLLDTYNRGLLSKVLTHELLHQWVSYLSPALGMSSADGLHYDARTSAGSLVGGFRWLEDAEGFVLDCTEGVSGAHRAPPIDRYMMGLVGPEAVPPLRAFASADPPPVARCGQRIRDVAAAVSIADIVALYGVRTPGPAGAQRAFALGFVAESQGRFLDPTELTFYDTLAAHYTRALPPEAPDPYHGSAEWAPVTRFFGDDVAWRSDLAFCGNGRVDAGEDCDDANRAAGDGCDPACRQEIDELPLSATCVQRGRTNPRRGRRMRVAVLSGAHLDARAIVVEGVRLGVAGAAPIGARTADVDRDGRPDVVLRFVPTATGIACGDATAVLTGRTGAGRAVVGTVPLRLAGCRGRKRSSRGGRQGRGPGR